jgi:uncharacterized protein YoaH (UPF0181 family)
LAGGPPTHGHGRQQARQAEQRLAALMLEGLESGPAIPAHRWPELRATAKSIASAT